MTEEYPQGKGATAFVTAQLPTSGGATMIATLLFPAANLQILFSGMHNPELLGTKNA